MIPLDWDSILFLSFACSSLLFVWFETNAIYEYLNYFNLGGKFLYNYKEYQKKDFATLLFIPYLLVNYNSFFTRLICCVICLSFWINLIVNLYYFSAYNFPFTFVFSLLFYYILILFKKFSEKNDYLR